MSTRLPPLSALRAFEAAARHLSLTKAAAELNVTPGALSHQIRGLEDALGTRLFERRVRAIALTVDGRTLLPGLQQGFASIRDAVALLRSRADSRVLVVAAPPGFTSKWLAPRLYRFATTHPDIDTRISSAMTLANFATDGIDVAVRTLAVDAARDPGLVTEQLVDISVVPVCSPRLLEGQKAVRCPADLLRLPLIYDESPTWLPTWSDWFGAAGIAHGAVGRGLRFSSPDHALDAAIEGGGLLLANSVLAFDDLRTGRLVAPVDRPLATNRAYYCLFPRSRAGHRTIVAFRDWIVAEVAAMTRTPTRGDPAPRRRHATGKRKAG